VVDVGSFAWEPPPREHTRRRVEKLLVGLRARLTTDALSRRHGVQYYTVFSNVRYFNG
jgi:hypothetical protein